MASVGAASLGSIQRTNPSTLAYRVREQDALCSWNGRSKYLSNADVSKRLGPHQSACSTSGSYCADIPVRTLIAWKTHNRRRSKCGSGVQKATAGSTLDSVDVTDSPQLSSPATHLDEAASATSDREVFENPGKVFVSNLPVHLDKETIRKYFRQFGPIENIVLIRSLDDPEKSRGFCFVYYGGPDPAGSAVRAVELDGAEFHGNVLIVRLDDGRREKNRQQERENWVENGRSRTQRSQWHEERENASTAFRICVEKGTSSLQQVTAAFQKINRVLVLVVAVFTALHGNLATRVGYQSNGTF